MGQLELDGPMPFAVLDASDDKSRRGADIPLRPDLATELRQWLGYRLADVQATARAAGGLIPDELPHDSAVFNVPEGLLRILDRDLKFAGIPKKDDRGRTVDIHGLRHTFGTHLSKAGVAPRVAQAAMRHSSIDLTMNVYTDPRLLDVHGALDSLPALSLDDSTTEIRNEAKATGTDNATPRQFAPAFAPKLTTGANHCRLWAIRTTRRERPQTQKTPRNKGFPEVLNSREFRSPVELFLASVAEWESDVVRLVMAA